MYDYSLFIKFKGNPQFHMLVHVDDLLITGQVPILFYGIKNILKFNFKLKYLRYLRCFLVLEVPRSAVKIILNQRLWKELLMLMYYWITSLKLPQLNKIVGVNRKDCWVEFPKKSA